VVPHMMRPLAQTKCYFLFFLFSPLMVSTSSLCEFGKNFTFECLISRLTLLFQKERTDLFVPSNGELIIRDNIANGLGMSAEDFRKSSHQKRPTTMGGYRFGKLSLSSFFTRHNPHPRRVAHFKGKQQLINRLYC